MAEATPEAVDKKEYQKPKLTLVRLAPEEAVLAVCKNGAMGDCIPDPSCTAAPRS